MNVLIALAGEVQVDINKIIASYKIDFIIAVDGGYNHMEKQKIKSDIIIGDFDSIKNKNKIEDEKKLLFPKEKDETDFAKSLKYLDEYMKSYQNIYVVGYVGQERIEHFYSNLSLVRENMFFIEENQLIYMLKPGIHKFNKLDFSKWKYISFFAYETIENLSLDGFKYEIKNKRLEIWDNLCISNEFLKKKVFAHLKKGKC